ncbi:MULTISPECIES: iron-containing redox enzyme family protein [Streptomyces]|uniref:Iron-containing redox enzyme family protein n=1 Tax=Streptomyces pratensis (strain ATCC 33331 / IAF-45CD) TaxID=591167 RepID=A0A8D3WFH9_STRFA|nr:iron-containing redox enzyme family protein [Streptomyces sp. SID7815]MYT49142.1 iron-containing redox enzyme family protein [Streptomyces sp. SID7815]
MTRHRTGPPLPRARGELSAGVIAFLRDDGALPDRGAARDADPYGDDLQLALYVCYELHYRGFAGVRPELEWDPPLLTVRGALEDRFLTALRHDVPATDELDGVLEGLLVEPIRGSGVSWFLQDRGELRHLREYAIQRSLYHLKEADPHAWVLPRLSGRAKAGMAAIEYDEFGAGRADRVHAGLFAGLMSDLGLDTAYGRYLDQGCAPMLALVNVMSLFGLHRRLRGALVGHFAAVEITSSPGSRRLAHAMKRNGAGPAAEFFYTEHVEADAVHEQVVRRDVIGGLLDEEPAMATDIAFGITATSYLEERLGDRMLADWKV